MDRCPACRGRLVEGALCPRCGCDCSLPLRAENLARRLLADAIGALAAGRESEALAHARQALTLKNDRLTRAVARFVLGKQQPEIDGLTMGYSHRQGAAMFDHPND